ncbi:hypothetical protein [Mycobacterium sp.]|nr:hypothetical protein [Mycobacterium sp.]HTY34701.1 hypothetical protein [Mycobacterium sp.]
MTPLHRRAEQAGRHDGAQAPTLLRGGFVVGTCRGDRPDGQRRRHD